VLSNGCDAGLMLVPVSAADVSLLVARVHSARRHGALQQGCFNSRSYIVIGSRFLVSPDLYQSIKHRIPEDSLVITMTVTTAACSNATSFEGIPGLEGLTARSSNHCNRLLSRC
jgi:hypothetical protein